MDHSGSAERRTSRRSEPVVRPWMTVREAADLLGFETVSLRRAIERNARKAPDGVIEAAFDGVRARKLGRSWRVQLGLRWVAPDEPAATR